MQSRHLPLLLGLLAFVAAVLVLTWWRLAGHRNAQAAPCDNRPCPNIVLVILDDMPWDHFGFLGVDPAVRTPNLDQLAQQGVVYTNTYNSSSRCRASLATYLTGQLPHQNLIYANKGVLKLFDEKALPRVLKEAGYATFAGGKMWEADPEHLKLDAWDLDTFHFARQSQDKLATFLQDTAGKQPLFIWWAPMLPHKDHNASEKYLRMIDPAQIVVPSTIARENHLAYRQAEHAFLGTVAWVDEEVGKLRQLLVQNQLEDNTWIVVLSDNGWSNAYAAKGAPYDIGVRTPMIIYGPGLAAARSDALVSTRNLYGSLLQLAGLAAEGNRALDYSVFSHEQAGDATVYWASYPSYTGKSEPDPRAERDVYALSLREGQWQYTLYVKSHAETGSDEDKAPAVIHTGLGVDLRFEAGEEQLFDLSTDPWSQRNLAGEKMRAGELLRYRKQLFQWWLSTGGRLPDNLAHCELKDESRICQKYRETQH